MFHFHPKRAWDPRPGDPEPLDEALYLRRRELIRAMGLGGILAATGLGCGNGPVQEAGGETAKSEGPKPPGGPPDVDPPGGAELYPAKRNPAYDPGRPLTPEEVAARYNNFYEFLPTGAGEVWRYVDDFQTRPWKVSIGGLVEKEREVDSDQIAKIAPLEERLYRFRCVEAWSMTVPWTGLPMRAFVDWCKPKPEAKYIRFVSFLRPDEAPGQKKAKHYPWPYYEGLTLAEARNELTLLVTGIYGHGLPVQHGAPLRVIVPWKYGYKSPKSFVRVEFTAEQPGTFWSDLQPSEYPFTSNVDPAVPHPRWSQATERDIATGDRRPTLPYNGYGEQVAALYR